MADWAKALVDAGGPVLKGLIEKSVGGGLKGKIVGGIADSVLKSLAESLGTQPTPEAIGQAIERDPIGSTQVVQRLEAEVTQSLDISTGDMTKYLALISEDSKNEGLLTRLWRPLFAIVYTFLFAVQVITVCWLLWTRQLGTLNELGEITTFLSFMNVAALGVLGVQIWKRTEEKKLGV